MEKPTLPTLWTIQLVHTDLSRFDAYLREEMAVMMHASLSARHEDQAMTTGWDTTNPHLYYYEWHLVSRERWPDVVWGVDKRPKLVIGWLTASDYVAGKLTVECGCTERIKHIFNLLLDGIVTTFDSTDGRQQKQIIDVTIAPAQQNALQLPTIVSSTVPGKDPEATAAQPEPDGLDQLTAREKEVAVCLAQGLRRRQIAEKLMISDNTVKTHFHKIARKWNLESTEVVGLQTEAKRRGYG